MGRGAGAEQNAAPHEGQADDPQKAHADRRLPDPSSVEGFLADHPELAELLPRIEGQIHLQFGEGARVVRSLIEDTSAPEGVGHVYLSIRTPLGFEQELERLENLLTEQEELLGPVSTLITVGTL